MHNLKQGKTFFSLLCQLGNRGQLAQLGSGGNIFCVPQLTNIIKNSETNYTYSFHHTPLTYKILSSNSLYFSSKKKEKF
jgi:hypothetical protein